MLIMNPRYYDALEAKYIEKDLTPSDLPPPCSGVPMTAIEYDYKTFYVDKQNELVEEEE